MSDKNLDTLLTELSTTVKDRLDSNKRWIDEHNKTFFRDKQYKWQAWRNCKNRLSNPSDIPSYSDLIAEQKRLDNLCIDKAIAEASEHMETTMEGLRVLHQAQRQLLEANQQQSRIKQLHKKFFASDIDMLLNADFWE